MAWITDPKSKRRWPAVLTAGILLSAALAFGTFSGSAGAEERGGEHRDAHHRDWNGGYYAAPPVVYGSPYYAAPPVVYGYPFGLNINIR
jgi:hypothetical protein